MSNGDHRNTASTSSNPIVRALVNHWTVQHKDKSEAEERLESNLCLYVPIIPFNRWFLFFAAFIIQFCCGSLYSWSVYNTPIDKRVYPHAFDNPKKINTANMAVTTFYIAVAMFGVTSAIMGPWLERHGPRNGLMLGTMVFWIGNAVTAISLRFYSIIGVYIGYGVLGGFGLGLNYICPVSALQKWFPDYRGIASGFAVGGFGAGSVVWGKVIPLLLNNPNVGVHGTFGILGSVMGVTLLVSTIVLRTPPHDFTAGGLDVEGKVVRKTSEKVEMAIGEKHEETVVDVIPTDVTKEVRHYTLIESIQSADYLFLYLMMFANEVFGLVAISRLSNMCTDVFGRTPDEGATAVAVNGAFNCIGRLVLPMISDLAIRYISRDGDKFNPAFARKCVFWFTLSFQVAIVASLPTIMRTKNYTAFLALIWILTACYGSGWGTIPCFLTDMWGPWNIGALHGIVLTSWSIAGVGGGLGFNSRYNMVLANTGDYAGAYISNFYWIIAILAFGIVVSMFIRTNAKDRAAPGYQWSFFGKKIIHIRANN